MCIYLIWSGGCVLIFKFKTLKLKVISRAYILHFDGLTYLIQFYGCDLWLYDIPPASTLSETDTLNWYFMLCTDYWTEASCQRMEIDRHYFVQTIFTLHTHIHMSPVSLGSDPNIFTCHNLETIFQVAFTLVAWFWFTWLLLTS